MSRLGSGTDVLFTSQGLQTTFSTFGWSKFSLLCSFKPFYCHYLLTSCCSLHLRYKIWAPDSHPSSPVLPSSCMSLESMGDDQSTSQLHSSFISSNPKMVTLTSTSVTPLNFKPHPQLHLFHAEQVTLPFL